MGGIGDLVHGQAGPCMGLCMGGAWRGGDMCSFQINAWGELTGDL